MQGEEDSEKETKSKERRMREEDCDETEEEDGRRGNIERKRKMRVKEEGDYVKTTERGKRKK
jgi:hypothetical protein